MRSLSHVVDVTTDIVGTQPFKKFVSWSLAFSKPFCAELGCRICCIHNVLTAPNHDQYLNLFFRIVILCMILTYDCLI